MPVAEVPSPDGLSRAAAVARPVAYHSVNLGYRFRNQLVWMGELLVFVFKVVARHPDGAAPLPQGGLASDRRGHLRRRDPRYRRQARSWCQRCWPRSSASSSGSRVSRGSISSGSTPLTGLLSAFANTRELSPLLAGYGLAAQMGCRFTAQLGAMKVNEEIDALEVMSIPRSPTWSPPGCSPL